MGFWGRWKTNPFSIDAKEGKKDGKERKVRDDICASPSYLLEKLSILTHSQKENFFPGWKKWGISSRTPYPLQKTQKTAPKSMTISRRGGGGVT